jgi:hypothetical protein
LRRGARRETTQVQIGPRLVGLAAKNAILIVEFAVELRHQGKSLLDAAVEAGEMRLRPIVMTSLAFIFGCVPLAIAMGAGMNARHSLGTGIIGGMIGASSLALLFVPLFFYLFEQLAERGKHEPGGLRAFAKQQRARGGGGARQAQAVRARPAADFCLLALAALRRWAFTSARRRCAHVIPLRRQGSRGWEQFAMLPNEHPGRARRKQRRQDRGCAHEGFRPRTPPRVTG